MDVFARLVTSACLPFLFVSAAAGQYMHSDLRDFADRAITNGTATVTKPEFQVKAQDDGSKVFVYDLGGGSLPITANEDYALERVVGQQLRVAVLRRYRNSPAQREFWTPILRQVEHEVSQMLEIAQEGSLSAEQRLERLSTHEDRIEEIYATAVKRAAQIEGITEVRQSGTWVSGYAAISFASRPKGRIFYISAGVWDLYTMAVQRGRNVREPEWNEVALGATNLLGGKYWFKAAWSDGTVFRTNGPLAVNGGGVLEFTPSGIRQLPNE